MELKVIDYLKNNQFEGVPVEPGQKAAEYIISRIRDYYEDSYECDLFTFSFVNENEYLNMLSFYEKVKSIDNKDGLDEFVLYAFNMLDMDLNENIINNMEQACTQYYDSLLSSDIEFLLIDSPYDEVIQHCNCAPVEDFETENSLDDVLSQASERSAATNIDKEAKIKATTIYFTTNEGEDATQFDTQDTAELLELFTQLLKENNLELVSVDGVECCELEEDLSEVAFNEMDYVKE